MSITKKYNHWKERKKAIDLLKKYNSFDRWNKEKCIYIERENISYIPEELKHLKKACKINVDGNKIKEIPSWLTEMKKLKELNVQFNNIEKININLILKMNLKLLFLSGNLFSETYFLYIQRKLFQNGVIVLPAKENSPYGIRKERKKHLNV